ncbi:MAG: VOC family protein [Chromatiales bacterium]|nr:VOC family protein [Chromatiales bacterium]
MSIRPIPDGYHSLTPYLSIKGGIDAIEFYKQAFGASELYRLQMPDGQIGHAELLVGDSRIMMSETCEESPIGDPLSLRGSSIGIYLYVEDVDTVFEQAIAAGAEIVRAVEDQFYGDRTGTLKDPFGHIWFVGTHKEDLSPEEIQRRAEALFNSENG